MPTLVLKEDLTVAAGEVRTYDQGDFIYATAVMVGWFEGTVGEVYFEPSIINYGEMHLGTTQSGAPSLFQFTGSLQWNYATFENYGLMSAIALNDLNVRALFAGDRSPTVYNAGTIVAQAINDAIGFENWGSNLITNAASGTISVQAAERAMAIYLPSGGTVTNNGSLLAHVTGGGHELVPDHATGVALGGRNLVQMSLLNTGLIQATDDDPTTQHSAGIRYYNTGPVSIVNSGTIRGDYAIKEAPPLTHAIVFDVSIKNSGLLDGRIAFISGRETLENSNRIIGDVDLGAHDDIYDGAFGTITGVVRGGSGNDRLLGGSGVEMFFGDEGDDQLAGGGGNDLLSGGVGIDILTGGAGNDSFQDIAAGLNGDTITDFSASDRIVISDATLSGFSFNLSANTLTYTGGSLTLTGGVTGTLVATAASGGGVQLTVQANVATNDVRNDFNGDGRSDILWRNVDGQMSNWLGTAAGGFTLNNANAAAVVPVAWQIAGTGDFNGDGRDDILWRNVDGQISNWLANASGGYTQNNANAAAAVPTAWHVVGTGDFNGDGRDDILWRNDSGTVSNWLGTTLGGFTPNDANAARFAPTSWHVVGTGDFNGDGRDDVLWRSDSGQLSNWLGQANGGFVLNDSVALTQVDTAWKVVGTGDFNGDGRDDILWRHTDGTLSNWLGTATGGFVNNGGVSGTNVPLAWSVVAIGDYNGDGRDDILWRNTDGTLSNWLGTAAGGFTPNDANAATPVPTSWEVQPEPFLL